MSFTTAPRPHAHFFTLAITLTALAPAILEAQVLTTVDDTNEIHLGAEYAFFAGSAVVAARLGAWLDPDHSAQQSDPGPFAQAEAVPGANEIHLAAGLGIALDRLQIDLGVDLSERRDTASLSAIYSF